MDWDAKIQAGEEYGNLAYFLEQFCEEASKIDYVELERLLLTYFLNVEDRVAKGEPSIQGESAK